MPDTKVTLLVFPLFVMFMIAVVSIGNVSDDIDLSSSANLTLSGSRNVTDEQVSFFDNFVENRYTDFGEPIWDSYFRNIFVNVTSSPLNFTERLNEEFGYEFETGHKYISSLMLTTIDEVWENSADNVDENDVRYVISRDPQGMEEWHELQAGGVDIDSIIVFVGIFVGIAIIIGIIGIRIFGIGLADTSIFFILQVTIFILLWALLSAFSYGYLSDIPVLGAITWILLTFMYMLGAVLYMTGD